MRQAFVSAASLSHYRTRFPRYEDVGGSSAPHHMLRRHTVAVHADHPRHCQR